MTPTDAIARARTRPRPRRLAPLAALAIACGAAWGCGGSGDGFAHFPVRGTVQLDGRPLKAGTITFTPEGPGASGSAPVADGAFALEGADGLSPGAYRVEVYSVQPTGRKVANPDDPEVQVDETRNLVDRRYNVDSTLKAEIPAGGPAAPLSFEVASPGPGSSKKRR